MTNIFRNHLKYFTYQNQTDADEKVCILILNNQFFINKLLFDNN